MIEYEMKVCVWAVQRGKINGKPQRQRQMTQQDDKKAKLPGGAFEEKPIRKSSQVETRRKSEVC